MPVQGLIICNESMQTLKDYGYDPANPEDQLAPNPGPQAQFVSCSADILIFGGSAGGGKTIALLFDCLKYIRLPAWRGVIFRRLSTEITGAGGIWGAAKRFFGRAAPGCRPIASPTHRIIFPSGAELEFRHLNRDETVEEYRGNDYAWIGFEEANRFTAYQFFYMLSRNRSDQGYPCRVRLTTNPDSDSWLKHFIDWWIDPVTGYANRERAGLARYLYRSQDEDKLLWYATAAEARAANPHLVAEGVQPKSVVFIPSKITDNPYLSYPGSSYLANLKMLSVVERERLEKGNWKIAAEDGLFKRHWFKASPALPVGPLRIVRAWDLAATAERDGTQPCYTAGVLMAATNDGIFYVKDVKRFRAEPDGVLNLMAAVAGQDRLDHGEIDTVFEHEGGSGGKFAASQIIKRLAGYRIEGIHPQGNKEARAAPFQSQAVAGNVHLLPGDWQEDYLNEMVKFPFGRYADQVDATSLAFSRLTATRIIREVTTAEIIAAGRR